MKMLTGLLIALFSSLFTWAVIQYGLSESSGGLADKERLPATMAAKAVLDSSMPTTTPTEAPEVEDYTAGGAGLGDLGYSGPVGTNEITGIPNWFEGDFMQTFSVVNFEEVHVGDYERSPTAVMPDVDWTIGSAAFEITAMGSAGLDKFCVAGTSTSSGDVVVQTWKLITKQGQGTVGGGGGAKSFWRKEIFRGPLEAPVIDISMDPESRFLLLLTGDGTDRKLYQFDLGQASSPPVLVHDFSSLIEIENLVSLGKFQHALLGRIWHLSPVANLGASGPMVLLLDSDNDGIFDSEIVDTVLGMSQQGFLSGPSRIDNFRGDF